MHSTCFKIFTFLCLFSNFAFTQPSITWQRLYDCGYNDDDYLNGICKTTDGNYVLCGLTLTLGAGSTALKINNNGDIIWLKHFYSIACESIIATGDGGCIVASPGLLKVDHNGDSLWYKNYPDTGFATLYNLISCSDGGYLGCGRTYYEIGYVLKTDSLGNFLWQKFINIQSQYTRLTISCEAYSDGYLVCGITGTDNNVIMIRLNEGGDILPVVGVVTNNKMILIPKLHRSVIFIAYFNNSRTSSSGAK